MKITVLYIDTRNWMTQITLWPDEVSALADVREAFEIPDGIGDDPTAIGEWMGNAGHTMQIKTLEIDWAQPTPTTASDEARARQADHTHHDRKAENLSPSEWRARYGG